MIRVFATGCLIASAFILQVHAQTCQWAYTAGLAPRSQTAAIKEDQSGGFYFAANTDSVSTRVNMTIEKRDATQQLLWQKIIYGDAAISDIEVNYSNNAIVIGDFTGTIDIDGIIITSNAGQTSGFIFEVDVNGTTVWAHAINPLNTWFSPYQLYISNNGNYYITAIDIGNGGGCSFHKLDAGGNIIKSEFTANFNNRTFTNLLTDDDDNVYLSGTCGSNAGFDTISSDPNMPYQNFLVKYDSTFKAQWLISKNYITFDDNNRLTTDGQNYFWVFDEFQNNADTIKILKVNPAGQILSETMGPMPSAFFPAVDYSMDRFGNSVLLINIYTRLYLYRYDVNFNIIWTDTIFTHTSGFPIHTNLMCYDSSFYVSSFYIDDTLMVDNFQLINPNSTANYPSDIFVAKWSMNAIVSVAENGAADKAIQVYPNPADAFIIINGTKNGQANNYKLTFYDITGRQYFQGRYEYLNRTKIPTFNLQDGVYLLKIDDLLNQQAYFSKVIVSH